MFTAMEFKMEISRGRISISIVEIVFSSKRSRFSRFILHQRISIQYAATSNCCTLWLFKIVKSIFIPAHCVSTLVECLFGFAIHLQYLYLFALSTGPMQTIRFFCLFKKLQVLCVKYNSWGVSGDFRVLILNFTDWRCKVYELLLLLLMHIALSLNFSFKLFSCKYLFGYI